MATKRIKGDCDVCRLEENCKISQEYFKKLAAAIIKGKEIEPCKDWR